MSDCIDYLDILKIIQKKHTGLPFVYITISIKTMWLVELYLINSLVLTTKDSLISTTVLVSP